jgi:hypothetical protein
MPRELRSLKKKHTKFFFENYELSIPSFNGRTTTMIGKLPTLINNSPQGKVSKYIRFEYMIDKDG